ncbi:MAG: hypothetical protein M9905_10945 [Rhizobiaceae bacterium]|nr:hypothetical protein [Rhizobiaceae bacterium]
MTTEELLSREGRDVKVPCEAMAFYEARFRLRKHKKDGLNAALVQFLFEDERPIFEEHVSPNASPEVGRYCYLKTDPTSGLGIVRFFAPAGGGTIILRFRAWANRHPMHFGPDVPVRRLSGWTIAAEPGNREPVRITSVARPLSVPVPAAGRVRLGVTLRSEADGDSIVLHAPCAMTIDGGHVKLDETLGEVGCLRPFARRGAHVVLDLENLGQTPVALSIACEGPRVVDIKEIVVAIGPDGGR